MSGFEDRLMTSLSADDEAFLKELEDDVGLFQQMGMTFSGPLRYWTAFAFMLSFAIFILSLWAGYNMLQAENLKLVVLWGRALWLGKPRGRHDQDLVLDAHEPPERPARTQAD